MRQIFLGFLGHMPHSMEDTTSCLVLPILVPLPTPYECRISFGIQWFDIERFLRLLGFSSVAITRNTVAFEVPSRSCRELPHHRIATTVRSRVLRQLSCCSPIAALCLPKLQDFTLWNAIKSNHVTCRRIRIRICGSLSYYLASLAEPVYTFQLGVAR